MDDLDRLEAALMDNPATRAVFEERRPAMQIGRTIVELRIALGLSLAELAARSRVPERQLEQIELGQCDLAWDTVARILGSAGAELTVAATRTNGKRTRIRVELPGQPVSPPSSRAMTR
jgi:transcriptional regulator with XRE-family HTH domain